jgi:cell division protein FtsW
MRKTISLYIAVVLVLCTVGLVMLYSASSPQYEDSEFYIKRQFVWQILALSAAVVTSRIDYRLYMKVAIPVALMMVVLLVLVRIPGIGHEIKGSYRWLKFGGISVQPSEFAKMGLILLFSWWLARSQRRIDEMKRGIIIPISMLACFALPILASPDYGTTMLISLVCVLMMFMGGVMIAPLILIAVAGLLGIAVLLFNNPLRMGRILAFLDPQKYEREEAWQLVNSLRAFASGGLGGVGYGGSMQKYDYLPEAHTDFIFPIICEELGLWALLVIALFVVLLLCGLRIAWSARDDFGRFLALGITLMISVQALINLAVVTGCAPTKGIALPFISYGGSSILVSGVMVGIMVNIAHAAMREPEAKDKNLFKDRARKV